jgi:hypothetical protein
MSTKIFGLVLNELRPSHDLELNRSREGLWTASMTLSCRYVDHANAPVVARLQRETPITDLDAGIPIKYDFITLSDHKISHQRGGITKIRCTFKGQSDDDGFESDPETGSVSYSFRGVMTKEIILRHPNYLFEVKDTPTQDAIAAMYYGEAGLFKTSAGYRIISKDKDVNYYAGVNGVITDETHKKWIDKISRGDRDYDKPMIEWSVVSTNKDGMTQSDVNNYGRKVANSEVPGDPIIPSWATQQNSWWHFSDIAEDKDGNSSTFSRTYTLRDDPIDDDLYNY